MRLGNFLRGVGSVLDIMPAQNSWHSSKAFESPRIAHLEFIRDDTEALRRDWSLIGRDIFDSIQRFGEPIEDHQDVKAQYP